MKLMMMGCKGCKACGSKREETYCRNCLATICSDCSTDRRGDTLHQRA